MTGAHHWYWGKNLAYQELLEKFSATSERKHQAQYLQLLASMEAIGSVGLGTQDCRESEKFISEKCCDLVKGDRGDEVRRERSEAISVTSCLWGRLRCQTQIYDF